MGSYTYYASDKGYSRLRIRRTWWWAKAFMAFTGMLVTLGMAVSEYVHYKRIPRVDCSSEQALKDSIRKISETLNSDKEAQLELAFELLYAQAKGEVALAMLAGGKNREKTMCELFSPWDGMSVNEILNWGLRQKGTKLKMPDTKEGR